MAPTAAAAASVQSQFDKVIRANYSNPPGHGAEIVDTILRDAALRKQWEGEVATMRNRINDMRKALVAALKKQGVPGDYSFIERQRGMFSFSGLTKEQVAALQTEHAIYAVGSGRINVAGLTPTQRRPRGGVHRRGRRASRRKLRKTKCTQGRMTDKPELYAMP